MSRQCEAELKSKMPPAAHAEGDIRCDSSEPLAGRDPEDGITISVRNALSARRANISVKDWKGLWMTLFPMDPFNQIPSPGNARLPVLLATHAD